MLERLKRALTILFEPEASRELPKDKIDWQQGGFAGPFASPGLGVDDSKEAESGIAAEHARPQDAPPKVIQSRA